MPLWAADAGIRAAIPPLPAPAREKYVCIPTIESLQFDRMIRQNRGKTLSEEFEIGLMTILVRTNCMD